jgi:hypothetical protein
MSGRPVKILHLMVGSDNWKPTHEELIQVIECFESACEGGKKSLSADAAAKETMVAVATNHEVKSEVLSITEDDPIYVLANFESLRETIARRLLNEFLIDSATHQPLPLDASKDTVNGFHLCLSNLKKRIEELLAEETKVSDNRQA